MDGVKYEMDQLRGQNGTLFATVDAMNMIYQMQKKMQAEIQAELVALKQCNQTLLATVFEMGCVRR